MINLFPEIEFENSSEYEVSPNHNFLASHGFFSNPQIYAQKFATYYSSPKFDADDELSGKNETIQVNSASSGDLSSYSAALPRKDPPAMIPKNIEDPI